jgi:hypothetical protein
MELVLLLAASTMTGPFCSLLYSPISLITSRADILQN